MFYIKIFALLWKLSSINCNITPLSLNGQKNPERKAEVPKGGVVPVAPQMHNGFVQAKTGHLYLGSELFDFRGFNGPTLLDGTNFENTDLLKSIAGFGTPVTRTYTLKVANKVFGQATGPKDAHITGWDRAAKDWTYNEEKWRQMDNSLAIAAKHGVKIIMPLINQDYGMEDSDFVGNFIDLIRHRFNIADYATAQVSVDWFVDPKIRVEFKKIIKKFMTRVNTVNGRVYGHDDTFLAFETGNEMNWANISSTNGNIMLTHTRPAPGEWTIDIAKYIKSLAPETLVMDGSFARNPDPMSAWPEETLKSPYVDIFSYHMYGDGDISIFSPDDYFVTLRLNERVRKFGKTFVVGEHGFYNSVDSFARAHKTYTCAGALIWSLRSHADSNGFVTHSESTSVFSYHVPGWETSTAVNFDPREAGIVRNTYQVSFEIINKPVAKYPVPGAPFPFFATNGTHLGISWKGAAWAEHYEIWAAGPDDSQFVKVAGPVFDNVDAGDLFIPIDVKSPKSPLEIPFNSPVNIPTAMPVWRDTKWSSTAHTHKSLVELRINPNLLTKRSGIPGEPSRLVRRRSPPALKSSSSQGAWYAVRAMSVDGIPGVFSEPAYIAAS